MRYRFRRERRRKDRKITFMAPPTEGNEFNEAGGDYTDVFTTRASMIPAPGTEKYANRENVATAPVLLEVRAEQRTLALTPDHRAKVFNPDRVSFKVYEIVSLEQPERGADLVISAVYNGA
jgi:hypothetical protein